MSTTETPDTPGGVARGLGVELNALNTIAEAERKGKPRDLIWPWFAANVSVFGISYGAFLLGFGIERDPNEYLSYLLASDSPPNGFNFIGVDDPAVEELMLEGRVTLDQDARAELYQEVGRLMRENLAWIPLYQAQDLYGVNARLSGFQPDVRGVNPNVANWSVE